MSKIIMRLATIETVATKQALHNNLHSLETFTVTAVNGKINKIYGEFAKNYIQLLASGASVNDPISLLFKAYHIFLCYSFRRYIGHQYKINLTASSPLPTPMRPSCPWL